MRYVFDNDLHVHSKLSFCSSDSEHTTERILEYAKQNNLKTLCLTDHFWDETVEGASNWYKGQNYQWISRALPLPTAEGIKFMFGCETEMDKFLNVGITKETCDKFDFIVIPTTHLHMMNFTLTSEDDTFERRAQLWVDRFDALLNKDLPFEKIGIAHLTCILISSTREEYPEVLKLIPEEEMRRLFKKAAKLGIGIELNGSCFSFSYNEDPDLILKPYKIAKECGCKFYCCSDAHHPADFEDIKKNLENVIDLLNLTEDDKFHLAK